jgi:large subunit ribosomal protein L15
MPLQRRLPKRGFRSPNREEYTVVNLAQLQTRFDAGAAVDPAALLEHGLVRRGRPVKILGQGELSKQLTVRAHAFSASAKAGIEKAGGATEVIARA